PYRRLTDYGRRIFRLCVNTIVSGAMLAMQSRLPQMLTHNQERLDNICKGLNQSGKTAEERLQSTSSEVQSLSDYWLDSAATTDLEKIVGTGRLMLQTYLETNPTLSDEVREIMESIVHNPAKLNIEERLELFQKLSNYNGRWRGEAMASVVTYDDPSHIVQWFIEYAAKPHRLWY
ncbi:MAG TPA: hypothetical protein VFM49_24430, partial [Chloroflexia bacterium]|nr:hypothetical protein [Chloroflexia bacterium]